MVTLREFIKIAPDLIEPWCCYVYLKYEDEDWGETQKTLISEFEKTSELNPYLDYEILDYDEEYSWGELDRQCIWLREATTEETAPVVHGHWIENRSDDGQVLFACNCSVCVQDSRHSYFKYCPNCGSKMDEAIE